MNNIIRNMAILTAIGVGASIAGRAILRQSRWFEWQSKRVIVTGGSRGLGLCLARQLVEQGARVAICARTTSELALAERQLNEEAFHSSQVVAITCDVTDPESVQQMIHQVITDFGGIDVLINNAGVIEVGPFDSMTQEDFQRSMDTHCWGTLNTVQAALPFMRNSGWGRILNVASLGGKRAVPHMLPYAASKFALVGLSTGLRAELAHENILVTTVCPGLMRTGSPRNARFKGQHRQEYAWFSIGDSLPLMSMNATEAADRILEACQKGDPEVVIAGALNFSNWIAKVAPNWTTEFLSLIDTVLPEMGGIGRRAARGYESQSKWSPSWLTKLSQEAAIRNNEMQQQAN